MPIGVNLSSNPVSDCCLTIKSRSERAPLIVGGNRKWIKVPLLKGDLGGSRLGMKPIFINFFRLKLTLMGIAVSSILFRLNRDRDS